MHVSVATDRQFERVIGGATPARIVVHVARNPATGVWTVMNQLQEAQTRAGARALLGLLGDRHWPDAYIREARHRGVPHVFERVPTVFGTAAFWLFVLSNPVRTWARQLRRTYPSAEIVFHLHNAWLSGGYLPLDDGSNVRVVTTFHGVAADDLLRQRPAYRALHRGLAARLVRHGSALTAVSRSTVETASELFGIPRPAFRVVPNGVSLQAIERSGREAPLRVGFLGQIHEGKGWHIALEAVTRAHGAGHDLRFAIAGSGPDEARLRQALEGSAHFVKYMGHVPRASESFLRSVDVLLLPTRSEGLPMVLLEAMARGIVVVATAVGGIPEVIEHGRNGLLVSRDVAAVQRAIVQLSRDRAAVRALSAAAFETVRDRFTLERVCAAYDEVYRGE
jgi:glycosyltransferase involved in cell wall biosynthesis